MSRGSAFDQAVDHLVVAGFRFDDDLAHKAKQRCLADVAQKPLRNSAGLVRYHDCLLFLLAHPSDKRMLRLVEAELQRIGRFLRELRGRHNKALNDKGLPWVDLVMSFSHDTTRWLLDHPNCKQTIDDFDDAATADLNAILKLTLCNIEHSETTAGLDNIALLEALGVPDQNRLRFVLAELGRFDTQPYVKDQLYASLGLFTRLTPTSKGFSKAHNRLPLRDSPYWQRTLERNFDPRALINSPLPDPRNLQDEELTEVVRVIKTSMVLTCRETDPGTYLDARTLRLVDLEHGLSVAIYGMEAQRQLALESYVGFTLFKNGLAAAYGGAWLLGPRAAFGMNIFEPYRGGESGYMMCQVLRTYRQLFGASCFEVDAHQFGLDNPDGIATGAFWFYYRHGFRPLDSKLAELAERERATMKRRSGYRSSERTLLRFTGSDVAVNFEPQRPTHPFDLLVPVTQMISKRFGGDRQRAERECLARFELATGPVGSLSQHARGFVMEMALVAAANGLVDTARLTMLRRQAERRADDLFGYQKGWFEFFDQSNVARAGPKPQQDRS